MSSVVFDITVLAPGRADQVVLLCGELDMAVAAALEEVIDARPGMEIVVDLAGLLFIDASGLRVLVAAYQRAQRSGSTLRVANARSEVDTVLRLTDVGELLRLPDLPTVVHPSSRRT